MSKALEYNVITGDVLEGLGTLDDGSVNTCVTSPPYWRLRDYEVDGQIGLEKTVEEYVEKMVDVFREVRRVLRDDGTLWLNIGDGYSTGGRGGGGSFMKDRIRGAWNTKSKVNGWNSTPGLKRKELVGMPWSVAKALQQPYYTGKIKNERDRVWLSAIIDGEGTICGFRHKRKDDGRIRTGIHVFITNSCLEMLSEADRIWTASKHEHMKNSDGHLGEREMFRWIPSGSENKSLLLAELYPYLISKKKQALVAWNMLEFVKKGKGLGRSVIADEIREKRDFLVSCLSDLNHGKQVDIPGWLMEPPSLMEPGWYLRQEIIWHKPNPMPESVSDRPTRAHEQIFLMAKQAMYYYDFDAIKEPVTGNAHSRGKGVNPKANTGVGWGYEKGKEAKPRARQNASFSGAVSGVLEDGLRNRRSVWSVHTQPCSDAHFATFPEKLITPCIVAGCPEDGTVLDPFCGRGTTGMVAVKRGRRFVGVELNPEYAELSRRNIDQASKQLTLKGLG